jgi:hypothetical protein
MFHEFPSADSYVDIAHCLLLLLAAASLAASAQASSCMV